jgi:hypothetical protein
MSAHAGLCAGSVRMGVACSIAACLADLASAAGLVLAHPANTANPKTAAVLIKNPFAFIFVLLPCLSFLPATYTAGFNAHLYRQLTVGDFHRGKLVFSKNLDSTNGV